MRILLNLFLFVISSLCHEETELQCSAKPGCQITQCDQAPLDWTKPGFNLNEHLQRNEFPITCVNKNAGKTQQNSGNLLPLITGNIQDIRNVESNLKNIEKKVEDNKDNIKGMADLEGKVMEHSTDMLLLQQEITELREINKNQSLEIEKQSKEINKMRKENEEQSSKLKQQIEKMQNLQKNLVKFKSNPGIWYEASNGNYYKLFHDTVNYTTAKANCEKYGARLASAGIRDDDVRSELISLLKAGGSATWIGLNDIVKKGTYYWEDRVRGRSIPWGKDQPNNVGGNQDCVEIGSRWKWKLNDQDCPVSRKYLCEITI